MVLVGYGGVRLVVKFVFCVSFVVQTNYAKAYANEIQRTSVKTLKGHDRFPLEENIHTRMSTQPFNFSFPCRVYFS